MMPGVSVKIESASTAAFNAAATGKWFCVQLLEKGSITKPIFVTSMAEFRELCGGRVSYSSMYDAAETFFEEGGSELFLGRVVGETPVAASLVLKDQLSGGVPQDRCRERRRMGQRAGNRSRQSGRRGRIQNPRF